jgi:poly(A) polymerase
VEAMTHAGILGPVLGGAPNPDRLARLKSIEAFYSLAHDPVLRLAALAVQTREDAERLRERLRLSNAEHARLANASNALAPLHCHETPPGAARLRRLLYVHGRQPLLDALALAHAESRAMIEDLSWRAGFAFVRDHAVLKLPFAGADLIAKGFARGPAIGAALAELEAAWMEADFPIEAEALEKMLERVTKEPR